MPLAAVMTAPNQPVEVQQLPDPILEKGKIIIEILYSEVCGTAVYLLHGRLEGVPYPIIPGHFSVDRVVETGGRVTDVNGKLLQLGAIATFLDVHETCYNCWYCLVAKASTRCPQRKLYGVTYSAKEGLLGGWSQLIYLKPEVKVLALPEEVSPQQFIAAGCALPTALHAIDQAQIQIGDVIVVQGCGPVGLSAAILALLSGAGKVIVIDKFESRLAVAKSFGVDETLAIKADDPRQHIERVLELTKGHGADVTIEATGVPIAVKEGLNMTRSGGRYVIVGHYTNMGEILINPHLEINLKHIDIRGTWGMDFSHFYRMIQLLKRHGDNRKNIAWKNLISRSYTLEQIN